MSSMNPVGGYQSGVGGYQSMNSLGMNPNSIAQQADLQQIQQLQQLLQMLQSSQYQTGSQNMGQYGTMPPSAMMPYGMQPPSSAFNNSQPQLGQSYYGGPSPFGQGSTGPQMPNSVNNMAAVMQMLQQAMQGMGGGMGGGMTPGGVTGSGNYGGMPGGLSSFFPGGSQASSYFPSGGLGGVAGLNTTGQQPISNLPPIPGETPSQYAQRLQAAQTEQIQEQLANFTNAMQLQSNIFAKLSSLNTSIIQNIR